jgi:hypothetical protein
MDALKERIEERLRNYPKKYKCSCGKEINKLEYLKYRVHSIIGYFIFCKECYEKEYGAEE